MNNGNFCCKYNKLMGSFFELPFTKQRNQQLENGILKTINDALCNTKDFGDLFIVQQGNIAEIELNREVITDKYQDLSEFEHFCNELYFVLPSLDSPTDAVFEALKYLVCGLNIYKGRNFCLSLSIDLGECDETISMTAHYWQFREGESIIDENLDNYDQPILYARIST